MADDAHWKTGDIIVCTREGFKPRAFVVAAVNDTKREIDYTIKPIDGSHLWQRD